MVIPNFIQLCYSVLVLYIDTIMLVIDLITRKDIKGAILEHLRGGVILAILLSSEILKMSF